jgi:hypothetical protein
VRVPARWPLVGRGEELDTVAAALSDPRCQGCWCPARPESARPDAGDGRLGALRELLVRCRARVTETLGPREWEDAAHRSRAVPIDEAIVHALAALETA